jgi:hypothetical protein
MRRMPFMVVAFWAAFCSALAAADRPAEIPPAEVPADKTAADQQAMQGRWFREAANRQGAIFRIEKLIDGTRDTITEFDANGNTIHSHTGTFKLTLDGSVRLFTFSNITVTAGPNLGAHIPGPGSFIYKLDGDTLYEFQGLLEGDRRPLAVYVWKRVKNNP